MKDFEEFRRWMMGRRWSVQTVAKTLQGIRYLENTKGLTLDSMPAGESAVGFFSDFMVDIMCRPGCRNRTLNNYVTFLNRYMAYKGVIGRLARVREDTSDRPVFVPTDVQARAILEVDWGDPSATCRNRLMVFILLMTGLRIGELTALDVADVLSDRIIVRHGKGDKKRSIFIAPVVYARVQHYIAEHRARSHASALFTTVRGRLSYAYARKKVKEAGHKAGVPAFHPHAARHWRAISWANMGIDLHTIMMMLGHSSLKTTQIYLRMRTEDTLKAELSSKDPLWAKGADLGESDSFKAYSKKE